MLKTNKIRTVSLFSTAIILTSLFALFNAQKCLSAPAISTQTATSQINELIKKDQQQPVVEEPTETISKIIVDEKPFYFPADFKKSLKSKGITTMTFGNEKGEIRLVYINGKFLNPCKADEINKSKAGQPCLLDAGLSEAHMLIANIVGNMASPCGFCSPSGARKGCDKKSNKRSCSSKNKSCLPSTCSN